ncbi:MAG: tetratricopeptide repeat protein, partial [Polyangiales bacterium]
RGTATEVERHLNALRALHRRGDDTRVARLLLEDALAWERAGDLTRSAELFDESMKKGPELLPAVQGARRLIWGLREDEGAHRPRITMPFVKTDATGGPTLGSILSLLDHEARLSTKESERADLLVERARILEAQDTPDGKGAASVDHAAILDAYRNALTLRPSHAEALKGLEAALLRASFKVKGDDVKRHQADLAAHYGRLSSAYGTDAELVASYLASRALLLERAGDTVGAEEAYAAALVADGRVGPTREAYKRLLHKRGAHARLRDVLAEEAGREHDMARSVRLLYEAARISLEQLADATQAITLLDHAAARAPTDPSVDARVLDELVRLLEARGDAKGAATARRARIQHESDPTIRAIEFRRLAVNHEDTGHTGDAIAAYEEARAVEPLHLPTQLALDRLYAAAGKHEGRVALWLDEAAKARDPARRAAAYVRAAHVQEDDLAQPDEALELLRAAWVTDTSNVDAFDELTRLLLPPTEVRQSMGGNEGRSARALIELFMHAAQVAGEPARRIAYLEKVAALWEDALGDPKHAAEIYARVLALDPTRRFALLAMQRAYERSGEFRGLAQAIETEAEQSTDPAHVNALRLRAAEVWNGRVGDRDRAIGLIRRVLDEAPDHPAALRALLKAQEASGRHEEVVETLQKLIALLRPGTPNAAPTATAEAVSLWLEVGEIHRHRLGRIDDAIAAWRSALALDAAHPVATRELSHALRARGSWRAVADLEEQIGEATKDPIAAGLAWVRSAEVWEGRLAEDERAQTAYARALSIRADDLSAWEGLARLAERRGALRELEAAYKLRIDDAEVPAVRHALRLSLGELLVRRGDDPPGAAAALETVLAETPTAIHALRLAEEVYRRTDNDTSLARILTMTAQAVKDPLAKRGVLWDLVRLQEGRVSSSPPIAAYLLIYEIDQQDEAAVAGIVRLATLRLRNELVASKGERVSDGLPNVRGLLAFALRRQVAMTTDPA